MAALVAMTGAGESSHKQSLGRRHPFAFVSAFLGGLLANPLTRNGYALVASFAITSVLGVVFWIVAARLYPQDQVGIGGVVVTTMITLSSASQLGFGNWLNRELPVAGGNRARLILLAYAAGVTASLVLALAFLLVAPALAPTLAQALNTTWLMAWFSLAVAAWTLFALQDSMLAGLRLAVWVPVENAAYALIKLALLPALALVTLSGLALFAAWTLPLALLILAVNLPILWMLTRRTPGEVRTPIDLRRMLRLIGWDYAAGLALTAALGTAPILVLNQSGPDGSASYHLSWTITYALYLVGRSMGISLLAEGVASPGRLRALTVDALLHALAPIVVAAAIIVAGAPLIMGLFGPGYAAQGSGILRILALASIPWGCVTIQLALARVRGEMRMIFAVQSATLVLVVGLGLLLLPRFGPAGMALAWLLAHTLVLAGLVVRHLRRSGRDGAIAFALDMASALAGNIGKVWNPRRRPDAQALAPARLAQMLEAAGRPDASAWRPLNTVVSYSDSTIVLLGDPASPTPPRGVLKYSTSQAGMAALRRCVAGTIAVRNDVQHMALDFELPVILASLDEPDFVASVETLMPGQDGRRALSGHDLSPALQEAAAAIRAIHGARPALRVLDQAWAEEWIEGPLGRLSTAPAVLLAPHVRAQALRRLGDWQRDFWLGRKEKLGRCHGDCTPGNLMFEAGPGGLRLAGILDWEQTRQDAPADLDLALLVLAMRMRDQAGQIGDVVRQVLDHPVLDAGELQWIGAGADEPWQDPDWVRAIMGLAWLRHVAANLEKSHHYGHNRLWLAHNLDWVLRKFTGER